MTNEEFQRLLTAEYDRGFCDGYARGYQVGGADMLIENLEKVVGPILPAADSRLGGTLPKRKKDIKGH